MHTYACMHMQAHASRGDAAHPVHISRARGPVAFARGPFLGVGRSLIGAGTQRLLSIHLFLCTCGPRTMLIGWYGHGHGHSTWACPSPWAWGPVQEPVTPGHEPVKPVQEPVTPVQEPVKPVQEAAKSVQWHQFKNQCNQRENQCNPCKNKCNQ